MSTPAQLVDMCCKVMATLLPYVDSLDGIPEHLGRKIFEHTNFNFQSLPLSATPFVLFDHAYGSSFIHALRINPISNPAWISWLPTLALSSSLQYLYLDNLNIDLHANALIPTIGQLTQLVRLSMRHNRLCNEDVRALTAAARFSSSTCLRCIDLSGNGYLSEACLKPLMALNRLSEIHCSDTGIAVSKNLKLPAHLSFVRRHVCSVSKPEHSGWFSEHVGCAVDGGQLLEPHFEDYLTLKKELSD
ncbi:Leucine Rich repeat-containing domain protein [Paragonimus westermani]|uniref:Leucine Rich repeat-containing domain protein n=1 Tax=Paragonimus westermani TaxID=34504 RepID=A0A8T0DFF0_9TREM|nr:Leucine Rich repeat-containing domain protein [Paragonimus westermani]